MKLYIKSILKISISSLNKPNNMKNCLLSPGDLPNPGMTQVSHFVGKFIIADLPENPTK